VCAGGVPGSGGDSGAEGGGGNATAGAATRAGGAPSQRAPSSDTTNASLVRQKGGKGAGSERAFSHARGCTQRGGRGAPAVRAGVQRAAVRI
jgi:hypothetical protein